MHPIDIAPSQLETVQKILREHVPEFDVRAFGSRVSWTGRDTSDLDLVLMTNKPLATERMAMLRIALTQSDLPFRVDIVDWAGVSNNFREMIEKNFTTLEKEPRVDGGQLVPFGDCAQLIRNTVSPDCFANTPYVGLEHIGEGTLSLISVGTASDVSSAKTRFQAGDILFGKLRPYFRKVVRPYFDGICSTDIWVVRPTDKVDAGYLFYLMSSQNFINMATQASEGTQMPRAKWDYLARYRIPLPSISKQRAIADILRTLDDKIELNRRMNKTLEAMAMAIFKDWFVDFGPVRAKVEGRDPYLLSEIWDILPTRLVDSEFGKTPEGWEQRKLGETFTLTMGQSPSGSSYNDHGEGLAFFQGRADFGFRFPKNRKFCSAPTRIGRIGDTLISVRAPVGDINMAWGECCIGRGVAALRHNSTSSSFTYYYIHSIQEQISAYEHTGTVFGSINRKQLERIRTLEPKPDLIEVFDKQISPIDALIRNNTSEIQTLIHLRDSLLPKLVSRKVRVATINNFPKDHTHKSIPICGFAK